MRAENDRSNAEIAGAADRRRRHGRGLGPFSGGQLTIVVVAIAAMFAIPTAALASSGAFKSKTTTPTLTATNSSKAGGAVAIYAKETGVGKKVRFGVRGAANGKGGVGVEGAGSKYGVFSNGPFAVTGNATVNGNIIVSPGKSLACTACIGPKAISSAAQTNTLQSGESESGTYAESTPSGDLVEAVTFPRPMKAKPAVIDTGAGADARCPGRGTAARGFVCLYQTYGLGVVSVGAADVSASGFVFHWTAQPGGGVVFGDWTATAP